MGIIKRICNWFKSLYTKICTWFKNHNTKDDNGNAETKSTSKSPCKFHLSISQIRRWYIGLIRLITRYIVIGIILNIVAAYFYPELPKRIPIIFGWFDGWMQFGEFAVKLALGFINAFFHGNAIEFFGDVGEQFQVMWTQFVNWLSTIHF